MLFGNPLHQGDFNQAGAPASFGSSENFVIAFMGEGQKAHFDDIDYSGFANVDPAHSKYTMDDELIVSTGRMFYRLAKGFLGGMLEAIG